MLHTFLEKQEIKNNLYFVTFINLHQLKKRCSNIFVDIYYKFGILKFNFVIR